MYFTFWMAVRWNMRSQMQIHGGRWKNTKVHQTLGEVHTRTNGLRDPGTKSLSPRLHCGTQGEFGKDVWYVCRDFWIFSGTEWCGWEQSRGLVSGPEPYTPKPSNRNFGHMKWRVDGRPGAASTHGTCIFSVRSQQAPVKAPHVHTSTRTVWGLFPPPNFRSGNFQEPYSGGGSQRGPLQVWKVLINTS